MKFHHASLETCHEATGVVVAIDVLRAFSTAAYAFAAGATAIHLVSTVDEAFALKEQFPTVLLPTVLLMGEVRGLPIEGFDYGNSPSALLGQDLAGRQLIQRTSTGTQGAVLSVNASELLVGSFCCAKAIAAYIASLSPSSVTFVICGEKDGVGGDEDRACAEYLEALMADANTDVKPYLARVQNSRAAKKFLDVDAPGFPAADLEHSKNANAFEFAMVVERSGELLTARPLSVG